MSLLTRLIRKPLDQVEYRISSFKEEIKEDAAEILSKIIILLAIGIVSLFLILFVSFTLAVWLNEYTNTYVGGYAIVSGIYALVLIVLYLIKDKNFIYKRTRKYADLFIKKGEQLR